MPKLTIYSHNVCWTRRRKSSSVIASKIQELQPDIVCLQECGFASQIESLRIPEYFQSFVPLKVGKLAKVVTNVFRDKTEIAASGGLMILTKTKPIALQFVEFKNQIKLFPHTLAFFAEKAIHRGFLILEFEDYFLINIHLTADFKKKWLDKNLAISSSQINQLIEFIKTIKTKKIIITGDFNFTPANSTYAHLDNHLDLIDISNNIPFTYIDKKAKLDYIFTNLKIFYTDNSLVTFIKPPSDHFALLAEIEY
jgi:endonuclease/exonuclease/phosphatase family metal-dependent hydrolase